MLLGLNPFFGLRAALIGGSFLWVDKDLARGGLSFEIVQRSLAFVLVLGIDMGPIHAAELFDDLPLDLVTARSQLLKVVQHGPGDLRLAELRLVISVVHGFGNASGDE